MTCNGPEPIESVTWFLNTRALNHMCGRNEFFPYLDKINLAILLLEISQRRRLKENVMLFLNSEMEDFIFQMFIMLLISRVTC